MPTLLESRVESDMLCDSSTDHILLEFRGGLTRGFTRRGDSGFGPWKARRTGAYKGRKEKRKEKKKKHFELNLARAWKV